MFELVSDYEPCGDQPTAIEKLVKNISKKSQVLLGATGTGKTFTIANVINKVQKKTIIMVHNKTLASQLYAEFKEFFPNNHVEYYVSYFDFFQPEAYMPTTDTYIEKSAKINQEIEMLRLRTLNSLASANDVIVVASVAAIYASVNPDDFSSFRIILTTNEKKSLKQLLHDLVKLQYQRNDVELTPGTFTQKGDIVEIAPGYSDEFIIRLSFFDDVIEEIATIEPLTKKLLKKWNTFVVAPANEYITNKDRVEQAIANIRQELKERVEYFKSQGMLIEAQRIETRTNHDMEQLLEIGYCSGIENYSSHLEMRKEGSTPYTIFDYLKKDEWLMVVDESHISIPQIRGMHNTDRSRKETLIEYGFRLPSAKDNRPLNFAEFNEKIKNIIYVSATPNNYEVQEAGGEVIEQLIRPTGLLDPIIEVHPLKNQIDDLVVNLNQQVKKNERTFITVLTKRTAEELTKFLNDQNFKVAYIHDELKTLERNRILNDLRRGKFDAIIGINLLKEGLDCPEVSLVAILDADKPGLFRNETTLIQTIGRAARNQNGRVIMYGDKITPAMEKAINETARRRSLQEQYNKEHGITPKTIIKPIRDDISASDEVKVIEAYFHKENNQKSRIKAVNILRKEMQKAAKAKEYERAAQIRDMLIDLENQLNKE